MSDCIAPFLAHLAALDRSRNTIHAYRVDLQQFSSWFESVNGDAMAPDLITPTDLREFKTWSVKQRNAKPSTVNRKLASLSAYLKWAVEEGMIDAAPRMPSTAEQVPISPKSLDRKEMHALIRAVERSGNTRDQAILALLLNTGLRVRELSDLNLNDVEMTERKGKLVVRSGKGNKRREVPINAEARRALNVYLKQRGQTQGALFSGQQGGRLGTRGIQDVVRKYGRIAGLDSLTPHRLRHTFCTNLLHSGVDLVTVARLAGHSNIATTTIYTQPNERTMEHAVEGLSE